VTASTDPFYFLFQYSEMPHKEESNITAVPLHDTFAAEVKGVDFSKELSDEDFGHIYDAISKVSSRHFGTNSMAS